MYQSYWSLTARPFENRFDSDTYYPSEAHQAALLKLRYTIENRRAAALLCGGSGMGKSLVINSLTGQLPEFVGQVVEVVYPLMNAAGFVRYIGGELAGRDVVATDTPMDAAVRAIEDKFTEFAEADQQTVVVIDEAHLLEQSNLLEPIRLLLNLSAGKGQGESAMTLILCGQPTLMSQVSRNVSLDERVAVRCILNRFSADETSAYISHRLRFAGRASDEVFTCDAIEQIYNHAEGIPRRINRICDLALMVGYAQEVKQIDSEIVGEVCHELSTPAIVE